MNIINFINTLDDKSPANIRAELYKYGILSTYEAFKTGQPAQESKSTDAKSNDRMIFYTSKNQRFVNGTETPELWVEANGLIINTTTLKPVVIPPVSLMHNIDATPINAHLINGLYDIYPANDGTTINLYYWEPLKSWRISTSRSMDATDSNWGATTYSDILEELLFAANGTLEVFYKSLDKSKCYTFGFKHPSMHSFYEGADKPVYKMWFIQSANRETSKVSYIPDNLVQAEQFAKFTIRGQAVVSGKSTPQLDDLTSDANTAMAKFLETGEVSYGYILKSRDTAKTGVNSNILLESSLLQKIRHLYYHSNYNEIAKQMNYDREKFTIVHSYLNMNTHTPFIQLFPQYAPQYKQLGGITTQFVKSVMAYAIAQYERKNVSADETTVHMYESLNKQYSLNPQDKNLVKVISSYILTTNFVDVYYNKLDWARPIHSLKN